ncbi:MAG: DUF3105 domain-containing protein [Actinobacteria bacterium]|nr:DUF3105 domain-containing protein [Actinomycetota bacterium]
MAALVLAAVTGAVYLSGNERRAAQARLGGLVAVEDNRGRAHTATATAEPAPTSGPHLEGAVCGVQRAPVPPGAQIHALEHGAVALQYRPDELEPDDVSSLESFGAELGDHVLVAPNPSLEVPLMATAWTRRMVLDEVDAALLRDFATAFRTRGPESAPCPA